MITLWGVWDKRKNDWVAGSWTVDEESARARARHRNAVVATCYEARPAQFVLVPPEVVEAVKRCWPLKGRNKAEAAILNWIAQAVGEGGG